MAVKHGVDHFFIIIIYFCSVAAAAVLLFYYIFFFEFFLNFFCFFLSCESYFETWPFFFFFLFFFFLLYIIVLLSSLFKPFLSYFLSVLFSTNFSFTTTTNNELLLPIPTKWRVFLLLFIQLLWILTFLDIFFICHKLLINRRNLLVLQTKQCLSAHVQSIPFRFIYWWGCGCSQLT